VHELDNVAERAVALSGPDARILDRPFELDLGEQVWHAVNELFCCNWFTRVWTFQEALLARELAIRYDTANIFLSMNMLKTASFLFANWKHHLQPVPDSSRGQSSSGQDGLRRLIDLLRFGADFQDCESPWRPPNIRIGESFVDSLEMILLNDSKREASDLRDHVFASIALALRSRKPHEEVILPDYAKAVQQVYVETTRFIIAQRKSIDIIVHAQRVNLGGLGSQTPRFREPNPQVHWTWPLSPPSNLVAALMHRTLHASHERISRGCAFHGRASHRRVSYSLHCRHLVQPLGNDP
jgi:hypothetical protein